jgi:hypothetical protein
MTVPVELIGLLLTANGGILTVMCHLLITILKNQADMKSSYTLLEYKFGEFRPNLVKES